MARFGALLKRMSFEEGQPRRRVAEEPMPGVVVAPILEVGVVV